MGTVFVRPGSLWLLVIRSKRNNLTTPLDCWKEVSAFRANVAKVEKVGRLEPFYETHYTHGLSTTVRTLCLRSDNGAWCNVLQNVLISMTTGFDNTDLIDVSYL